MDFIEIMHAHAARVCELKEHTPTEEATKTGLIMPFLYLLGYNPCDPRVVLPEYCADFGEKKACKVDFAIKMGNDIVIILEAKKVGDVLDATRESQLQQYFQSIITARIAILTDGLLYKFYTDLEYPNVMDKTPFMTVNFESVDDSLLLELQKLHNDFFELETALQAARELKYLGALRDAVAKELEDPSEELVRFFARQVYDKRLTDGVVGQFRNRVKTALQRTLVAMADERAEKAMKYGPYRAWQAGDDPCEGVEEDVAVKTGPTETETEAYHIVKAIMSKVINPGRITVRDTVSYCGILLDDNNRKPICRLFLNNPNNMQIGLLDAEKNCVRYRLDHLHDIYKYAKQLRCMADAYDA